MPSEVVRKMEESVAAGQRSALVASLIGEWLDRNRKVRLRAEIIEGCREMAEVESEEETAYRPADDQLWR